MTRDFVFNEPLYAGLLKNVAGMTLLFSDGPEAYIDYRFVEKLFVLASGGKDISRSDKVFDAIVGRPLEIGVGVKTFVIRATSQFSFEKVQEFTRFSGGGAFDNLTKAEIAFTAAEFRNNTILADTREYGIDLNKSIYHCLIRSGGGGIIHEEPYPLIDLGNIQPVDKRDRILEDFPDGTGNIRFTDGTNIYSYSKSKSVLLKKFDLGEYSTFDPIPLDLDPNIWGRISLDLESTLHAVLSEVEETETVFETPDELAPGVDFVILPLYSNRGGSKYVEQASGINQWNAGGRERKYGEAYIPIPIKVHQLAPGFFPARDVQFLLSLPNSSEPVNAKVCQDSSKALMSNPNSLLCKWLYKVIDPHFEESDFDREPHREPFTYSDLERVGRDSVMVIRDSNVSDQIKFEIRFSEIGSYEDFLESLASG